MNSENTQQITSEELEHIVRRAFAAGEQWGVAYSTWFTPDKEEIDGQLKTALGKANRYLTRRNNKR